MSVALPFAGVGDVTASASETSAFGFSVERLTIGGAWQSDAKDAADLAARVTALLEASSANTIILRFPSEIVEIARMPDLAGRRFRHAGTLLYWEDRLVDGGAVSAGIDVDVFRGDGSQQPPGFQDSAAALIADSFDGYLNHYAYNTTIPQAIARDGYIDWARRTIADPAGAAIILRDAAGASAVATLRFHGEGATMIGEVELAAVATDRQGAGVYRDLWMAIRDTARQAGAERVIISTQANNIRVQRAWARLGLVPLASFDTIHVMSI